MTSLRETDLAEIHEKVEILSTDDEKIKLIGSLLSNDASRGILKLLFERDMTAYELAQKTGIRLSLVIFHLQKMQGVGIVTISKIGKNTKGHDMKFYGATRLALIILPSKFSEKAKNSKSLNNSLKKILKFTAIGLGGLVSWAVSLNTIFEDNKWGSGQNLTTFSNELLSSVIIGLSVVIGGLIIERLSNQFKK